jgi:translation elongation factor EF-Tu-like GTPase
MSNALGELPIGVTLRADIRLSSPDQGGRTKPVLSGYRPLCIARRDDGTEEVVGLCQLEIADELLPGTSGEGKLLFAPAVSDAVKSLLKVGSEFSLAEGKRIVGSAWVIEVADDSHQGGNR